MQQSERMENSSLKTVMMISLNSPMTLRKKEMDADFQAIQPPLTGGLEALLVPSETKDLVAVAILSQQSQQWKVSTRLRKVYYLTSPHSKSLTAPTTMETMAATEA
jgi:hypothetical protein